MAEQSGNPAYDTFKAQAAAEVEQGQAEAARQQQQAARLLERGEGDVRATE